MTSLSPLPLPETIGAYRVVGKLGAGQMGDVFEAIAPSGIAVAVKRLRFHGFDKTETHGRFRREIRLSQALQHPNIVRVIDHGFDLGAPYLVMEKLVGHDLEWWLEQHGPLPASVAVSIVRPIAEALAHAHGEGVVHRDFKPANVFLHEEGDTLRPVVCDFGIAKVYDEDGTLTASGAVLGTPLYMAPEQFVDSKRVDARCDVWALGMVLYCAVAGRPALADVNGIAELLVALKDERISQVQSFAPWVQASLARVIHAALLPRERRFASMKDFVIALDRWGPTPEPLTRASLRTVSPEERSQPSAPSGPVVAATDLGAPEDATLADPSKVPTDDFIGTVVGERYLVGQKLGIGGMGAVYDAADLTMPEGSPARSVALKVMLADARATESSRRFLREARAAQKVQNEHVARVLDVGIDPTTRVHYLVMDRLRGRDLAEIVKSVSALTPEVAVSLFIQACDGLEAAHALGIVHRDIKPSNLFVHEEGGRVVLKVCDFGIAKQLIPEGGIESTELTQTGGLLGSPLYMSPEQARSAKNVDARTDVFSLTLSLHEALSGRRPWPGLTSMGEIIVAVVTQDVPHLVEVAPWVDPRISAVVEKGLARDASQRIGSVRELAEALRPFALDRPLVPADLGAVSPERRAVQHPTLRDASRSNIVSTNDPVTMPAKRKSGNRPLVVGTLVAAVAMGGVAVAAWTQRGAFSTGATSLRDAPVPSSAPAPSALPLPSAQASATSLAVSASASAPEPPTTIAKTPPGAGAHKTKPKPSVTPSATQTASPSQAASGVGRGNTATDLPP